MTECDNAEIRDVLPDYVAETLSAAEMSRVALHVAECMACQDEVALLRVARAARPQAVHIDVDAIVSRLAKPGKLKATPVPNSPSVAVATARTMPPAFVSQRALRSRRNIWQFAAALAVVAIGGLSVVVARSGGVGLRNLGGLDSTQLSDVAIGGTPASPFTPGSTYGYGTGKDSSQTLFETRIPAVASAEAVTSRTQTVVSVGDLSDYTDAELQRMLDRLDKWDGATSSEVMPTMPLVPVGSNGAKQQ